MDLLEQFEYPLPILKVETEKIVIETDKSARGRILVSNAGGGLLAGRVLSNSPLFRFLNDNFHGNSARLEYEADTGGQKPGNIIRTNAIIMSNGGEKTIAIIIKVLARILETPEGHTLTGLKDFLNYTKKNPELAQQLFYSKPFREWLIEIGYEYMEIFEIISQDTNPERALENFFTLNKQKGRPTIELSQNSIEHEIDPVGKEVIMGTISIKKTGWGYIEFPINILSSTPWLAARPGNVTGSVFNSADTAEINYFINPVLIETQTDKARVALGEFGEVIIKVRKKPLFDCYIIRESFSFDDAGTLILINNTKTDVMCEVTSSDSFVKLDGKRYLIGARAEIHFKIKLSGIQAAQLTLRRQNMIEAELNVRCIFDKLHFKKNFKISICDKR